MKWDFRSAYRALVGNTAPPATSPALAKLQDAEVAARAERHSQAAGVGPSYGIKRGWNVRIGAHSGLVMGVDHVCTKCATTRKYPGGEIFELVGPGIVGMCNVCKHPFDFSKDAHVYLTPAALPEQAAGAPPRTAEQVKEEQLRNYRAFFEYAAAEGTEITPADYELSSRDGKYWINRGKEMQLVKLLNVIPASYEESEDSGPLYLETGGPEPKVEWVGLKAAENHAWDPGQTGPGFRTMAAPFESRAEDRKHRDRYLRFYTAYGMDAEARALELIIAEEETRYAKEDAEARGEKPGPVEKRADAPAKPAADPWTFTGRQ